jgi:hypothetical protein
VIVILKRKNTPNTPDQQSNEWFSRFRVPNESIPIHPSQNGRKKYAKADAKRPITVGYAENFSNFFTHKTMPFLYNFFRF